MKLITALIFLCAAGAACANPFPTGDAGAGKKIFDRYHCNSCHDKLMGGNGNALFTRPERKVHNADALLKQIHVCTSNVGANLSPQEVQDLGAYLNRFYNLK